jgi:hypothetical protein
MADKEGNLDAVLKEAVDLVTSTSLSWGDSLGCRLYVVEGHDKAAFWGYLGSWIDCSSSTGGFVSGACNGIGMWVVVWLLAKCQERVCLSLALQGGGNWSANSSFWDSG